MSVIKSWLWLVVMVLGVVCVVIGAFMIYGGRTAEDETIDGFSRTQVKVNGESLEVNSFDDIETIADYMKAMKYQLEDSMGVLTGDLEVGQSLDSEHRVTDAVKYGLYYKFADEGSGAGMYAAYVPTIDGQLVFGSAKVVLSLSKTMEYTGISIIIIGGALILLALMILGFNIGLGKMGKTFHGSNKIQASSYM